MPSIQVSRTKREDDVRKEKAYKKKSSECICLAARVAQCGEREPFQQVRDLLMKSLALAFRKEEEEMEDDLGSAVHAQGISYVYSRTGLYSLRLHLSS